MAECLKMAGHPSLGETVSWGGKVSVFSAPFFVFSPLFPQVIWGFGRSWAVPIEEVSLSVRSASSARRPWPVSRRVRWCLGKSYPR